MAFQNLLEGDCGGQNPLMKLGGHFSQDQAFRQDRLPAQFSDGQSLVNDFLEEQFSQNLQTFRMDTLAQELRDIDRFSMNQIHQAPNVAQLAPRETSSLWSEEFLRAEKYGSTINSRNEPLQDFEPSALAGAVADETVEGAGASFVRAVTNPHRHPWPLQQVWQEQKTDQDEKWIEAFLPRDPSESLVAQEVPLSSSESESKFQKFWQKAGDETQETERKLNDPTWLEGYGQDGDLEEGWSSGDNKEFWESMQKMWNTLSNAGEGVGEDYPSDFASFVDPYKTYSFEEDNPMKEMENPMAEGLRRLEAQDIPSAVLCFEAAVQAEPENALAWQYLGTTQAKNEQDPLAIAALKKCISLDPENLTALLSLAISYTNENYQNTACEMLREWLAKNPKYQSILPPPTKTFIGSSLLDTTIRCDCVPDCAWNEVQSYNISDYHEQVLNYFIAAANKNPVGSIDPDVQAALGVLFNLNYDYDKAVDCFKAALQASPNDHEMWNRLGATLANGNRSEEAVDAYYNALHLSPGFIRARYNLGITCINLQATREAAEHFLSALNQQAKGTTSRGEKGNMSDSIWSTLRPVVNVLDPSLLPAVQQRDLSALNAAFKIQ